MKIAFTGAQSTGKTTLVHELCGMECFSTYTCCDNITRRAVQQATNEGASNMEDRVQTLIIDEHLYNLTLGNFIADRCLIDCYIYGLYQYLKGCLKEDIRLEMVKSLDEIPSYDYIFYIEPEFGVVSDGVRSDDPVFQEVVGYLFTGVLETLKRKYNLTNIYKITGTVQERVSQILDIMKGNGDL